jgi:hypothetical protein
MSEQVHDITSLPAKPGALKRWSKRAVLAAVAVGAAALITSVVRGSGSENETETPQA